MTNRVPIAQDLFTWPSTNPALLGSRCQDCGIAAFPVAESCLACSSQDMVREELPGRGTLWTWTVQQFMPKSPYASGETMETFQPYGVGYLELPGGVRVEGRLTENDPQTHILINPISFFAAPQRGESIYGCFSASMVCPCVCPTSKRRLF